MAATQEVFAQPLLAAAERPQRYAESLASLGRLGAMAYNAAAAHENLENERELNFDDYVFAVTEMAATDEHYRERLDVDQQKTHAVIDGRVRAANREPVVEMIRRGKASSQKLAEQDPAMRFQFVRDSGDEFNAEQVDELPVGWTRLAPSMDPKKALKTHPEVAGKLGYKEGMMYWQRYSRSGETTVDTGSHSVDMSDPDRWRGVVRDVVGVEIPPDVPADEWIRQGINLKCTAEEADQLVRAMRDEYYKRSGATQKRHSVSEYVEQNIEVVEEIFDAYFPSLAEAINSGKNNHTMSSLARTMLQTEAVKKLKPEVRQQLVAVGSSEKFSEQAGRTMNSVLRYVAVEELRKGLPAFLSGSKDARPAAQTVPKQPAGIPQDISWQRASRPPVPLEILNQRMAGNLQSGVQAKRSYGGCAGQIELSADAESRAVDANGNPASPQSAYGGWGGGGRRAREQLSKTGKINCIKCKASVDEKEAKKVKGHLRCSSCKYEIDVCDNGREVHASEPPKDVSKKPAAKKLSELLAPVISLEEKRRQKQAAAAKKIPLGETVQLQHQNQPAAA